MPRVRRGPMPYADPSGSHRRRRSIAKPPGSCRGHPRSDPFARSPAILALLELRTPGATITLVSSALKAGPAPPSAPRTGASWSACARHWPLRSAAQALLLVSGEAGVGKPGLVSQVCAEQEGAVRALSGACDSLFRRHPLAVRRDRAERGRRPPNRRSRDGKPHDVAGALLAELSTSPTVLVVEVSTGPTRRPGRAPPTRSQDRGRGALVVATYRGELEVGHPLRVVLGNVASSRAVDRMALEPLSPAAVAELAEPYDVDAATSSPRPAATVLRHRGAPGARGADSGDVRDAVLARVAQLAPSAREQLVELIAVASADRALAARGRSGSGRHRRLRELGDVRLDA